MMLRCMLGNGRIGNIGNRNLSHLSHLSRTFPATFKPSFPRQNIFIPPRISQINQLCMRFQSQRNSNNNNNNNSNNSSNSKSKTSSFKVKLGTRVCVSLLFGGAILSVWAYVHNEKRQKIREQRTEQLRKVALGQNNFSLVDQNGVRRTKKDFLGQWVLLYFGFTHCPDICPEEMDKLSAVVTNLDKDLVKREVKIQPLFITVDPDRDDTHALKRYVADFHPRLIALTGTSEEVKEAGRDFRVYSSCGPKDSDGDYLVDHSILIYLINPDGLFIDYYNRMKDAQHITDSLTKHINNYVKL